MRVERRVTIVAIALAVVVLGQVAALATGTLDGGPPSYTDQFDGPDRLLTNELATRRHPPHGAVEDPNWEVTSGSLFVRDGAAWSGRPDGKTPDLHSREHTGSSVFRATLLDHDWTDVRVAFDLTVHDLVTTERTPRHDWDGVHVFLRWHDPYEYYAVSVARRDGNVVVKRKLPGGPSNNGTYVTLGQAPHQLTDGHRHHVVATARTLTSGVRVTLDVDGRRVLTAEDSGKGGGPITGPGRIGFRGDNADFSFTNLSVEPL